PALKSGAVVLADRYIFTLIARSVVRGINRDYLSGLYAMALRPHLTFWLNVRPETAFGREFRKAQAISYWEAGRDMSLSHDLYWSFIRYQTMIKREFVVMAKKHNFIELDGEASVPAVNKLLRQRIAEQLGIRSTKYTPSSASSHLWRQHCRCLSRSTSRRSTPALTPCAFRWRAPIPLWTSNRCNRSATRCGWVRVFFFDSTSVRMFSRRPQKRSAIFTTSWTNSEWRGIEQWRPALRERRKIATRLCARSSENPEFFWK